MLSAQTNFGDLPNGCHIWTRRVGHGPRKLMLLHSGTEMPWNYLTAFTDFAKANDVEVILVEMLGSYLSDHPSTKNTLSEQERLAEIQHVVAKYDLDNFTIHGIAGASSLAKQYVSDRPEVRRLLTDQDQLASARATEILGNFDNEDYLDMIRTQMQQAELV